MRKDIWSKVLGLISICASVLSCNFSGIINPVKSETANAEALVKQRFEKDHIKCGDSYFGDAAFMGGTLLSLNQVKDVTFEAKELPLTDADRLNGTEWKGTGSVNYGLLRHYNGMDHKWMDWINYKESIHAEIGSLSIEKRKGEWKLTSFGAPERPQEKITCGQIPN